MIIYAHCGSHHFSSFWKKKKHLDFQIYPKITNSIFWTTIFFIFLSSSSNFREEGEHLKNQGIEWMQTITDTKWWQWPTWSLIMDQVSYIDSNLFIYTGDGQKSIPTLLYRATIFQKIIQKSILVRLTSG